MTSINLTRDAAAHRSALITVSAYTLHLDITQPLTDPTTASTTTTHHPDPTTHFRCRTTVEFTCHQPGASTFLDLRGATIITATLNGTPLNSDSYNSTLSPAGETGEEGLPLPALAATNTVVIDAWHRYSTTGEGLHRAVDAADGTVYLYSQCEPADAKRVFACFDQPDMKAPITLTVTAPASWEAISNSSITDTTPTATTVNTPTATTAESSDAIVTHHFAPTEPLPPYLFALCAGPYHRWSDTYTWTKEDGTVFTLPLNLYCRESLAPYFDADNIFDLTTNGFDYYHRTFGILYPFSGSYDQVFVPDFNAGAMENVGCVTYREDYVFRSLTTAWKYERRADTILHEMAHMWFGNLVTMRWWDDLWLNESFASWASVMTQLGSTTYQSAWTTFTSTQKNWAYRQDDLPSTHPIAASMNNLEELYANFDGITYAKGCSVLKQLVAYAGLDPFLRGLHDYLRTHSYSNATFADLLQAVSRYCNRDFPAWAESWLTTTGRNTISVDYTTTGEEPPTYTSLQLNQTGAQPGAGELRPHRVAVGIYGYGKNTNGDRALLRLRSTEVDLIDASTPLSELVGEAEAPLILPNDEDLTYCKLTLDEHSLATVLADIESIADPLSRALCWGVLEEMTMHAELPGRILCDVLCRALPAESQLPVAEHLMTRAHQVLRYFVTPQWAAEEGWDQWVTTLLDMAQHPRFGHDQQLIALNALCRCPLPPTQLNNIKEALAADPHSSSTHSSNPLEAMGITGLTLDTDLRWTLLTALAAHGEATTADIDAALASDNTSMGVRRALTARAAQPTAASKKATWDTMFAVGDTAPSNWSLVAMVDGFTWAGQDHLLADYTHRYASDLPGLWEKRGGEIATTVTERLFPLWADYATVDATTAELLNNSTLPSGAHRLFREGLYDARRAQAGRDKDATLAD